MPTTTQFSDQERDPDRDREQLNAAIVRITDQILECPKNQTDNLIRKLKRLWKERDAVRNVGFPSPHRSPGELPSARSPVPPVPDHPSPLPTSTTETKNEPAKCEEKCSDGTRHPEAASEGPRPVEGPGNRRERRCTNPKCSEGGGICTTEAGHLDHDGPDRPGPGLGDSQEEDLL